MSVSPWFDYNAYMTNKVAQLKSSDPAGNWTMDKVAQAFAEAGYAGIEGAERHFVDFGQNEDVAPNAFFNPTEYYRAKAAHAYNKDFKAVTDADAALVKAAIKGLGMNAWSHYDTFGSSEKVNPSNQFDTNKYMEAKLAALNSIDGGKKYTIDEVYAAFKASGISALEHFMTFGGNKQPGEVAQKYEGAIPAEFAVPEEKKVNAGGGTGENFVLTPNVDNFTGTVGADTFIAGTVGSTSTLTPGDVLDGGAGRDTLKAYAGGGTLAGVTVKNVETFEINGGYGPLGATPTIDAAQYAGLDTINFVNTGKLASGKMTLDKLSDNFTVGFNGATSVNALATDGFELKYVDAATTANVTTSNLTGYVAVGINGKGITTLNLKGGMVTEKTAGLYINEDGITAATPNSTIKTVNIESTGGQYALYGSKIATVDASASTGNLWIDLKATAGAGTAKVIKGGAGNDTVWMLAADINKGDVIDLGEGKDMIGFNLANDATTITADHYGVIKAAGAETVGFFGGGNNLTVDASKIGGKDLFFNSSTAPAITVNNIASTQTITSEMGNTSSNKLVVVSDKGNLGAVNVVNEGKDDLLNIAGTSANSAFGVLNLSGDGKITVTGSAGSVEINGKDMTGVLDATGSTAKDFITGGAGDDILTGAGGADVLTGGAGKDTFNVSASKATGTTVQSLMDNMATVVDYKPTDKDVVTLAANSSASGLNKDASVGGTIITKDKFEAKILTLVKEGTAATTYFWTEDSTYIVVNGDTGTSNPSTSDQIVKLVGHVDFTDAIYNGTTGAITWGA